jgi:hypothetical protein
LNDQVKISPPEEQTCENCFSDLSETQINRLLAIVETTSIEAFCDLLLDTPNSDQEAPQVIQIIENIPDITSQQVGAILAYLIDSGVIDPPTIESGFFSLLGWNR